MLASVDMTKDDEIGEGDGGDDETVERSPFYKKPNIPTGSQLKVLSEKL